MLYNIWKPDRRTFLKACALAAIGSPTNASAVSTTVGSAEDFVDTIGANTHFQQKETTSAKCADRVLEELLSSGIRHIRDSATPVSKNDDVARLGFAPLAQASRAGIKLSLICFDPTNKYIFTDPRRIENIVQWCGEGVIMLEGSNEPVLFDNPLRNSAISGYYQRELYTTIHRTPALQHIKLAAPSYIQQNIALAEDLSEACDYGNLHSYPGMEHPETSGPGGLSGYMKAFRAVSGTKPLVISETGYHTALHDRSAHFPVSEEIRARYMPRLLLWAFMNGIVRTYIYEFVSSFDKGDSDKESNFGLLDAKFQRSPAYGSVTNLIRLCTTGVKPAASLNRDQAPPSVVCEASGFLHLRLRRADGSWIVYLWLGLSGWAHETQTAYLPIQNSAYINLGAGQQYQMRLHRFQDDGSLISQYVSATDTFIEVTVSDQVTAIEFF